MPSFKGEKMAKVTFNSLIYKAHNYYVAAGMTPEGAAALEGNQYAESAGFIPKRPQGDAPQGNPVDSSNEQTKEESDGQK